MESLNYSHLYYFYTIATEHSVTKASQKLGLAQPTLSAQLSQFENALGFKLFQRANRTLTLTEIGTRVYQYADEIFKLGAELLDVVNDRHDVSKIKLQIGVIDAVPKVIIQSLLDRVIEDADTQTTVIEGRLESLVSMLKEHKLDLVISNSQFHDKTNSRVFHHLVVETPVVVAAHPKWEYLKTDFPNSLNNHPLIMSTGDSWLRQEVEQFLERHSIFAKRSFQVQDLELQKTLALKGAGATILSKISVQAELDAETLILLSEKPICTEKIWLITAHRRLENPVAELIRKSFKLES